MGSLCGWLGAPGPDGAEACVERMGAALEAALEARTDPVGTVAVGREERRSGTFADDHFLIAWCGDVTWTDPRRTEQTAADGPGATLAAAYKERGPEFLSGLSSGIAFALLDRAREEAVLAVDRFGLETLTFAPSDGGVVFASDGRALAAHPSVAREVDPQGVYDFIYFHVIPSPRSIFRGWRKLRPAEYVRFAGGETTAGVYWRPSYRESTRESESALIERYHETSREAIRACLDTSEGPVGAFLSGGTDSSTVVGLLTEVRGEPARSYSIGFDVDGFDESSYARIAVERFGADHHEYTVTAEDVLEAAPRLARSYDEPFGNASAVASLYCARLAREDGIRTLFGGDGGDEIFAGNERYAKQKLFQHYESLPGPLRKALIEPIAQRTPDGLGPLSKAGSYVRQARIPLPDRLETYNFVNRIGPETIFTSDFLASVDRDDPLELLRASYDGAPSDSVLHRLLYVDLKFTLADNDLRKVGRTCGMEGIDVRYPFLDPGLVDFANEVPPELKLKGQKLRYFFKRASEGFLPDEILTKKKHGFGVPCGRWMREVPPLKELAYDSLASLRRRGYLSPAFIDDLERLHHGEHGGYYGVMVWVLTMLELWHHYHAD